MAKAHNVISPAPGSLTRNGNPMDATLYHVAIVEMIERDSWSGPSPDGFLAFKSEADAKDYIAEATKDYTGPVPDYYIQYNFIGIKECSKIFYSRFKHVVNPKGCIPFSDSLELCE